MIVVLLAVRRNCEMRLQRAVKELILFKASLAIGTERRNYNGEMSTVLPRTLLCEESPRIQQSLNVVQAWRGARLMYPCLRLRRGETVIQGGQTISQSGRRGISIPTTCCRITAALQLCSSRSRRWRIDPGSPKMTIWKCISFNLATVDTAC